MKKEKTKKFNYQDVNKQKLATYMAYVFILAISVLSSVLTIVFDTETFDKSKFIMNLCINLMIAIFGLILSIQDGKNTFEWKKSGFLWEAKNLFNETRKLIVDINIFRQYADLLYVRERKSYVNEQLTHYGIFDHDYLLVSDSDLKELMLAPRKCEIKNEKDETKIKAFDEITELQYHAIKKYKSGKFEFKKIEYSTFLYGNNGNNYKRIADNKDNERKIQIMSIAYRLSILVICSVIFAIAAFDTQSGSGKQIIWDTISRLFNLFTSIFMGYTLAFDSAKRKEECLLYKVDIINQFIVEKNSGLFTPIDYEQQILNKINEIEKRKIEEEEKRKKEVIIPEVVEKAKKDDEEFEITTEEIKMLELIRNNSNNK